MLHSKQKMFLHIYKAAAGLNDPTYRNVLREYASCSSAADKRFGQSGFDRSMAAIETVLFQRVAAGNVPNPIGRNRWIRKEFYWRNRLPANGYINTRQAHQIEKLWHRLCEFLPIGKRNTSYLAGIIHRATGKRDIGYSALKFQEAAFLIDALKDRLAYALKEAIS